MYATALIVFREILEAGLIIGIVLAATRGVPRRGPWILAGLGAGIVGALLTASVAEKLMMAMEGVGQEVFNSGVLFAAVIMLGWHSIWMQKHGRELAGKLRGIGNELIAGDRPVYLLAVVIGLAILREGAEIVLFLHGIAATNDAGALSMAVGALIGTAGGVLFGLMIYFGLLRIPSRYLFRVTTVLILLLASGMAAQGVRYLEQADIVPSLGGTVWNTSHILSEQGIAGQILHTLIGYTARPDVLQLVAYFSTLTILVLLMNILNTKPPRAAAKSLAGISTLVLAGILTAGTTEPASAAHKIYSPHVEQGELELEARGHITRDNDSDQDNVRKEKFEIGYGITDWWFTSIFIEYEREPGHDYEHTATAWENIFVLTEPGQYWADVGFYVEYEKPEDNDKPEKVELKLLLEKESGKWVNTLNLIAEREVGGGAEDEVEFGYAWRSKYRLQPSFEPGFELYGGLGSDEDFGLHGGQEHQIGPVFSGSFKLSGKTKLGYEAGYLFGLNENTPDNTFKWVLELETSF